MADRPSLFLSHSSDDSEWVIRVAARLRPHVEVYYYEEGQKADQHFRKTLENEFRQSDGIVIFLGEAWPWSPFLKEEAEWTAARVEAQAQPQEHEERYSVVNVILTDGGPQKALQVLPKTLRGYPAIEAHGSAPLTAAEGILKALGIPLRSPPPRQIFSYEKDILGFYRRLTDLGEGLHEAGEGLTEEEGSERQQLREKILDGCPPAWPDVVDFSRAYPERFPSRRNPLIPGIGGARDRGATVDAAALQKYAASGFTFPEAGPREKLVFPARKPGTLTVGIVVSGGIAPGINAVIDGIVQRHWKYAQEAQSGYGLDIHGYMNGLYPLNRPGGPPQPGGGYQLLFPERPPIPPNHALFTSNHAHEGGSILGTHRLEDLSNPELKPEALTRIVSRLDGVDILYVIGGDGSMKASHALWSAALKRPQRPRPLSVVAIPKTMDNDILWVWQAFGFLSAVEKARETVELLHTEVHSNPRLCVIQLFGSDSGFVVSHAVLASSAGHCQLALIPEVPFSMLGVARHLKTQINRSRQAIPSALMVMAETAIPVDLKCYLGDEAARAALADLSLTDGERRAVESFKPAKLALSEVEKEALQDFTELREKGLRIEGQTSDALRSAGLKVVTRVLRELLPVARAPNPPGPAPDWDNLRFFSNEPRHLLRAIPPSTTDIITGQRLGMLAVDNAMAGYTDFMISQWLTEFVLVPLELVVLGRKRIPDSGIFWKSVLAKTGQPPDLESPWPRT